MTYIEEDDYLHLTETLLLDLYRRHSTLCWLDFVRGSASQRDLVEETP